MKKLMITMTAMLCAAAMNAKTLVAYYSYTNNVERIVTALRSQIDADVVEIEPAEKDLTMRRTITLSVHSFSTLSKLTPTMPLHIQRLIRWR